MGDEGHGQHTSRVGQDSREKHLGNRLPLPGRPFHQFMFKHVLHGLFGILCDNDKRLFLLT